MRSILDYIKVFKNIEMYKDPKLRYAKAEFSPVFDPDLEQSEPLRPGETLETWKPNPFLKPHAEGGRAGYNDGNTVLPEPNPLSQEERNQKVFNDYVERFKEYLKGSKMPEWFVKDLIKKKAKELGIELADGGRAGYNDGQLVRPTVDGSRPGYNGKGGSSPGYRANLLENLPDGYLDDYKANFYNTIKDGKLTHVGGAQPPSVKGSLKKGIPYMMEKYEMKHGKVADTNSALKASFQSQIESGAKMGYNIRIGQLRAVAPWNPKAPKGMELHHFLPKLGIEGTDINFASTRNTAFISKELNRKMSPYDTKLKKIQLEQIELLENKPKDWRTKIERLNKRARGIYKNAAKEVPGSAGYLGFSEIKIKPDGGYTVEIRGIDYNKSLSGIDKADEIFYRDPITFEPISRENRLKVNKMSNIKNISREITSPPKNIKGPPKNIKGAISMELLDDMFKAGKITVGTSKGIMQAARKIGAEFEIAFLLGEFFNNVGKGQRPNLAWANAKQSATFGLQIKVGDKTYGKSGDKEYFEELKKLAKEEGIDPSTFEKVYEINKREHLATTMGMTGQLSPLAQIKTLEDQLKKLKAYPKIYQNKKIIAAKEKLLNTKKEQLEKYKKETLDKEYELIFDIRKNKAGYRNNIRPNLQKIADTPVYEEEYSDAFKNLGSIAVKYLDREKKKAYNPKKPWVPKKIKRFFGIPAGQGEQLHSDMGPLGNLLSTNIFNMDVLTKQLPEMGKYAWDVINPTTPLPKLRTDFRTEAQKEQHRILDMVKKGGPGELYRYNLARDVGPGVSLESFLDLAKTKPGLGIRTEEASGGRAGYMGGGIAGIRKPSEIPPERGGLRSIMINGKKY